VIINNNTITKLKKENSFNNFCLCVCVSACVCLVKLPFVLFKRIRPWKDLSLKVLSLHANIQHYNNSFAFNKNWTEARGV